MTHIGRLLFILVLFVFLGAQAQGEIILTFHDPGDGGTFLTISGSSQYTGISTMTTGISFTDLNNDLFNIGGGFVNPDAAGGQIFVMGSGSSYLSGGGVNDDGVLGDDINITWLSNLSLLNGNTVTFNGAYFRWDQATLDFSSFNVGTFFYTGDFAEDIRIEVQAAVPEPSTYALLLGIFLFGIIRQRRKRRTS